MALSLPSLVPGQHVEVYEKKSKAWLPACVLKVSPGWISIELDGGKRKHIPVDACLHDKLRELHEEGKDGATPGVIKIDKGGYPHVDAPGLAPCAPALKEDVPGPGLCKPVAAGPEKPWACKLGALCYRKNPKHLAETSHPGEADYCSGMIRFSEDQRPGPFETLQQLFEFFDADSSGHMQESEFLEALEACKALAPELKLEPKEAWKEAGGETHGHLNPRQFAMWVESSCGNLLPIGYEVAGDADRKCRQEGCSCNAYEASKDSSFCKACGHRAGNHRSDLANGSFVEYSIGVEKLGDLAGVSCPWVPGREGLVQIEKTHELFGKLQHLLDVTHKSDKNWTRDRGCKKHGRNNCPEPLGIKCAFANKVPVPCQYTLRLAFRNQRATLWMNYLAQRAAIQGEIKRSGSTLDTVTTETSSHLDGCRDACNEWFLFHGTSQAGALGICEQNFRMYLAGSGATWKKEGEAAALPLYGNGFYFAERITKADEYSEALDEGTSLVPGFKSMLASIDCSAKDLFPILICRVVGGRCKIVEDNDFDAEKLQEHIFSGEYSSVLGDRVTKLHKPYKEVVVYHPDQIYPEFLLLVSRHY